MFFYAKLLIVMIYDVVFSFNFRFIAVSSVIANV